MVKWSFHKCGLVSICCHSCHLFTSICIVKECSSQGCEGHQQSVAKLMTHSAKFWNLLDERRTTAKENTICQISPRPPQSMLITLSGTMVISCLVNLVQGGGGDVLPRFGILKNSPKTVKCVINFATDCSTKLPLTLVTPAQRLHNT